MGSENNRSEWAAAFQRATWGCAPAVGRALGLSPRTVQQWGQSDCEKRSPGERLEIVMRVALEHQKPHDALAPLHLLAERLGYRVERIDEVKPASVDTRSIAVQASEAMIEASEAVNVALTAQEDGLISDAELDDIRRECDEAIEALVALKRVASAQR
jgi:Phage regulatory protein CII (CP76)